jgi:DNA-binding beta-propeller fold protein YncE
LADDTNDLLTILGVGVLLLIGWKLLDKVKAPTNTGTTDTSGGTTDTSTGTAGLKYVFDYKFGVHGSGDGQFLNPHDISFDKANNVFVTDRNRNDVQVFTHDGKFLRKYGGTGSTSGRFNVPYSATHDANDNLYVADRGNNRIQKLSPTGTFISQITTAGSKSLKAPEDIVFEPSTGEFYVCDTGNERIVKFDKDHKFLLEWGSKGSGNGQFDHPHSMDVYNKNVYISSGNQGYIQVFDSSGKFLRKFSSPGKGEGQLLVFLEHMDIDSFGRLHIINNNARPIVSVFDAETGKYLTKYGSPEKEGNADGQFREPEHVTVDSSGKPFVVDSSNFRIQVFKPT